MKFPLFLLLANALLAQDAAKPPMPAANPAPAAATTDSKSLITIDPKARANDYVQAYDFLRKDRPTQKIMIRSTQALFLGVTDLTALPGGTLLMVKVLSNQGTKTQFVPVEQILEINYSP